MTVMSDIREIISNEKLMKAFQGKRVLITGASGLIGSMLIRSLCQANVKYGLRISIIGYARNRERVKRVLGNLTAGISMIYGEDFQFTTDCDYIIHTASPTSSKYFIEHPVETIDTILFGTRSMLELAKKNKAVFVYLSSMEEYGIPYSPGETMTEEKVGIIDHMAVRSCYPEGKRMCECMCTAYASEYNVDVRIVRLAQTFGAGIPLTDKRVSMQFALSALENRDIILHTEGRSVSNYCYLSDAISGILTVTVYGKSGEAYNICNDAETRSIYEIAVLVAERVVGGKIRVIKDIPPDVDFGYAPDNTMKLCSAKLEKLGWKAGVSMEEGYQRLIAYLIEKKENGRENNTIE